MVVGALDKKQSNLRIETSRCLPRERERTEAAKNDRNMHTSDITSSALGGEFSSSVEARVNEVGKAYCKHQLLDADFERLDRVTTVIRCASSPPYHTGMKVQE